MENKFQKTSRINVKDFVLKHFFPAKETKNGFRARCPFKNHEHDLNLPAFDINFNGAYYCHKCGKGGSFKSLLKFFNS